MKIYYLVCSLVEPEKFSVAVYNKSLGAVSFNIPEDKVWFKLKKSDIERQEWIFDTSSMSLKRGKKNTVDDVSVPLTCLKGKIILN